MSGHIMHQEVTRYLKAALECSIYVQPTEPGMTKEELLEASKRAGFIEGETWDSLPHVTVIYFSSPNPRLLPNKNDVIQLNSFSLKEEPDYRNKEAFHFVHSEMRDLVRSQGIRNAKIERNVLVERGVGRAYSRVDVQVAVTILVLNDVLAEIDGIISYAPGMERYGSPGDHSNVPNPFQRQPPVRRDARGRAYPIVKDIIDRRMDGRPLSAEPLDAFAEQLDKLGYSAFRMWWRQLVSELQHTSTQVSPTSVTVLCASVVEGALTFVVKHGRSLGLGVFGSTDFSRSPTKWQIGDLVNGAAAGGGAAILNHALKLRAEGLIQTRQRIHAGRMLTDYPGGVADLRPEEARDAKHTADLVVRRILDWLETHPAS